MGFYSNLKKALLPYHCLLCQTPSTREQDLCEACYQELPALSAHFTEEQRIYAAYRYDTPISNLILDLKFHHKLTHARLLGELMVEKVQHTWYSNQPLPQALLPVPLHAQRLRERGFNQALEIARPLAREFKLPLLTAACVRIKNTKPQALLAVKHRLHNIKNAFLVSQPLPYSHIALIDDVVTTGHTIRELCKVLKRAGVTRMEVWCCARPVFHASL